MEPPLDHWSRLLAQRVTRRDAGRLIAGVGAAMAAFGCASLLQPQVCGTGECRGSDGRCYGPCQSGSHCTTTGGSGCSSPSAGGVYCCYDNGGGSSGNCLCASGNTWNYLTGVCCPNGTPYYYPGTHGGSRGCYASCPYIGDCGDSWQRC